MGTQQLAAYTYGTGNGQLIKQTYGNGDYVSFTYDNLGRVKTATYSEGRKLTYRYTGDGQLYSVHDNKTGYTYQYSYDSLGRLMSSSVKNSSGNVLTTRQTYDANNQLTAQSWQMGSTAYSETYTYSLTTGLLATHTPAVGSQQTFGYDALQRLKTISAGVYTKTYNYKNISDTRTTTQVSSLVYSGNVSQTYSYTYDALGNILTYTAPGKAAFTYTYDNQGQLTKATNGTTTYNYSYDTVGNITAANGHSYTYGNTNWRDLLTAYDGQSITYDASGNPTSYYNGTRWTMAWEEGRRLISASGGGNSITYAYDSEGLRLSKTVNGTVHTYYYAGGKLMRETYGSNTLDFFYDSTGTPYALKHNGTVYYYVTNLQGDVTNLVNSSGSVVATYDYDPYGKVITATGTMAAVNPLRYRGYYYDTESGLYYLQSRYYDPAIGRFLNADSYASTGQGIIGHNMFVYCLNNPINAFDPLGEDAIWLQDTNNRVAGILGHTGLLIQDATGTWYYFNWTNGYCSFFKVDEDQYDYTSIESLMTIDGDRYDAAIYLEGDFSKSIKYAETLKENYSPENYKLVRNNCMQVVTDVLARGEFAQSDTCYETFLYRARNSIVPNVAYSRMFNFHNAVQTYHAAPKWAKWLYTSPERAVAIY